MNEQSERIVPFPFMQFSIRGYVEVNRKMHTSTKISIGVIVATMVIAGVVLSRPPAFGAGNSGSFNPQKQFPIGTHLTFTSINGIAALQSGFTKPRLTQYPASFTITAQVVNFTKDGGVGWKVLSGTFTINGQTYTVINGDGHMNGFDEIASGMDGEATGPDGATYHWRLNGLASLYNGAVIVGFRGGIGTIESNNALLRYHLAFMGTMSAT